MIRHRVDAQFSLHSKQILFHIQNIENQHLFLDNPLSFVQSHDVDYAALEEQYPSFKRDGLIPNNIIRKPIDVRELIERIELELLT